MNQSRLIVDQDGELMWLMFSSTYMVVTGVDNAGFNIDLHNVNSAYKIIFV